MRLKEVHEELDKDPGNVQFQIEELALQDDLGKWLANEEDQWRQKIRESWMQLGDKNTKFFYSVVKAKNARNHISELISEEGIATDLNSIKLVAPLYYEKLFNEDTCWNIFSEVIANRKLTMKASYWLSRNATHLEIKTAMFQMHPDKALGPDGYNSLFFQKIGNW